MSAEVGTHVLGLDDSEAEMIRNLRIEPAAGGSKSAKRPENLKSAAIPRILIAK
jgi:hypothetical protein